MVQTASLFSQLLHEVPRNEFARLVNPPVPMICETTFLMRLV